MNTPNNSGTFKKIVLWNAALLIAGVIVIELFFGGWISSNGMNKLNILGDVHYTYDTSRLYRGGGEIRYDRDKYGLRGEYKDIGGIDILTVGGSATDQRYLTEGETWQDVMRKSFEKGGNNVYIVNAGVDGQSTYGNIKDFDLWFPLIPGLKTKYILAYIGTNDIFTSEGFHNDDVEGTHTLKSAVKSKSVLYRMYRTLSGMYLARFKYPISHRAIDFQKIAWTDKALNDCDESCISEKLVSYESRLRDLIGRIQNMGAKPIIVSQASRMYKMKDGNVIGITETLDFQGRKINGVDYYYIASFLNKKTMDVCKSEGAICIDLANELNFDDDDFYDYIHNTPKGSEKVGHYLYSKLDGVIGGHL